MGDCDGSGKVEVDELLVGVGIGLGDLPMQLCFAFDADQLKTPGVTLWSAWDGETLAGMGALKELDPKNGELKSMRAAVRQSAASRLSATLCAISARHSPSPPQR